MMSSQGTLVYQVGDTNPMDPTQHHVTYRKYRRAKLQYTEEHPEVCPKCGADTITDMGMMEIYCPDCGLVVKASIEYSGVKRVLYPYGILL